MMFLKKSYASGFLRIFATLSSFLFLTGCQWNSFTGMYHPQGIVAHKEKTLLIDATLLILIIVIPVLFLTIFFAFRYRASNKKATYRPDWGHSNIIEAFCWAIPCIIILILAIMTWITTHDLDPFKPISYKNKPALEIQVISLDWKWLFIYPSEHIATINYLKIPDDRPIHFRITAEGPMNAFSIPQLGSQIYSMSGMETQLYLAGNKQGIYTGLSTNYSGDGFSWMNFKTYVVSNKDYSNWVQDVQKSPKQLTQKEYDELVKPSEKVPPQFFSNPTDGLFQSVINKYMSMNMNINTGMDMKHANMNQQD